MPQIRLIVEYNGLYFHGWQWQPGVKTVQEELQKALEVVLHRKIGPLHASGRTDAGVHARGQVVSFWCDGEPDLYRLPHAVSHLMKNELAVLEAQVVDESFHPRRSAKRKQYSYRVLNRKAPPTIDVGRVWHVSRPLEVEQLNESAKAVIGTHDFSSFRSADCQAKTAVKTIDECEWTQEGDVLLFRVVGKGFLKQMVRILVGTMIDINRGRLRGSSMKEILEAQSRGRAGITAPPHGLTLDWVEY